MDVVKSTEHAAKLKVWAIVVCLLMTASIISGCHAMRGSSVQLPQQPSNTTAANPTTPEGFKGRKLKRLSLPVVDDDNTHRAKPTLTLKPIPAPVGEAEAETGEPDKEDATEEETDVEMAESDLALWEAEEVEAEHHEEDHTEKVEKETAAEKSAVEWRCSEAQLKALENKEKFKAMRKASDKKAVDQWANNTELTGRLTAHNEKSWKAQRWVYIRHGICDPEMFVLSGIVHHSFMGYSLWVHQKVVPKLKKAEKLLARKKFKARFGHMNAFSARTVRGPGAKRGNISYHAYGMAIDIDPGSNRYFTRREIKLIEEISGRRVIRGRSASAAQRWSNFSSVSKRYKQRVNRWISKERKRIRKLAKKAKKNKRARRQMAVHKKRLKLVTRGRNLTAMRRSGLTTLPKTFVVAMEKAGFSWGTHFPSGADIMHFAIKAVP